MISLYWSPRILSNSNNIFHVCCNPHMHRSLRASTDSGLSNNKIARKRQGRGSKFLWMKQLMDHSCRKVVSSWERQIDTSPIWFSPSACPINSHTRPGLGLLHFFYLYCCRTRLSNWSDLIWSTAVVSEVYTCVNLFLLGWLVPFFQFIYRTIFPPLISRVLSASYPTVSK